MAKADFIEPGQKVRCKVGQYARIVEAPASPGNVGKLVFIEAMYSPYMPNGNPQSAGWKGHERSAIWRVRGVGKPLSIPGTREPSSHKEHIDTMMLPIEYVSVIQGGLSKPPEMATVTRKRGRPRKLAV